MTAIAELVTAIEARGVTLREKDGGIAVRPARAITPTEREMLISLKADVLAYLRGRPHGVNWSRVSLYQLDSIIEIAVPWSDIPLLLAPGCRVARELRACERQPGRVWCVCEALDLLLTAVRRKDARKAAEAKLVMGGTVTAVGQERRG